MGAHTANTLWNFTIRKMKMNDPIQITTLNDLAECAKNKRAVYVPSHPPWSKPKPAAVVMQLQAQIVYQMLKDGMFLYVTKNRKPGWKR